MQRRNIRQEQKGKQQKQKEKELRGNAPSRGQQKELKEKCEL